MLCFKKRKGTKRYPLMISCSRYFGQQNLNCLVSENRGCCKSMLLVVVVLGSQFWSCQRGEGVCSIESYVISFFVFQYFVLRISSTFVVIWSQEVFLHSCGFSKKEMTLFESKKDRAHQPFHFSFVVITKKKK